VERSFRLARLLVAAVVVIAAFGVGFVAAAISADQGDPVDEQHRMHGEMHATHGGMGAGYDGAEMERMHAQMDEMHAEMGAQLSPEDGARHERMHEACSGLMTERREG
jgi:hypothetical protein